MKKVTIHFVTFYMVGLALCLVGSTALFTVLWKAWPNVSASSDFFSTFEEHLWTREFDLLGVKLKMIEFTVLGITLLVLGIITIAFRRQILYVSKRTLLECPFCKHKWKANRAVGLASCPHCNKRVQPTVARLE